MTEVLYSPFQVQVPYLLVLCHAPPCLSSLVAPDSDLSDINRLLKSDFCNDLVDIFLLSFNMYLHMAQAYFQFPGCTLDKSQNFSV